MAVVATKSAAITLFDASQQTLVSTKILGGRVREAVGVLEVANGDSIASILRLCRIPSRARISRVLLSCDAITSAAGDIGVYQIAANGGAVIDVDHFASAQSIASALVNSDVGHEADAADAGAGFGLADVEKPLWQSLGLSADPQKFYDIAVTLTAAATAGGTLVLRVQWTDD